MTIGCYGPAFAATKTNYLFTDSRYRRRWLSVIARRHSWFHEFGLTANRVWFPTIVWHLSVAPAFHDLKRSTLDSSVCPTDLLFQSYFRFKLALAFTFCSNFLRVAISSWTIWAFHLVNSNVIIRLDKRHSNCFRGIVTCEKEVTKVLPGHTQMRDLWELRRGAASQCLTESYEL